MVSATTRWRNFPQIRSAMATASASGTGDFLSLASIPRIPRGRCRRCRPTASRRQDWSGLATTDRRQRLHRPSLLPTIEVSWATVSGNGAPPRQAPPRYLRPIVRNLSITGLETGAPFRQAALAIPVLRSCVRQQICRARNLPSAIDREMRPTRRGLTTIRRGGSAPLFRSSLRLVRAGRRLRRNAPRRSGRRGISSVNRKCLYLTRVRRRRRALAPTSQMFPAASWAGSRR